MRGQTHILLALGLATLVQAQSSVVTVYFLEPANRPSSASANYGAESFGASVVEAAPEATTYELEHSPISGLAGDVSIMTVVNGPSTYAQWRVHDNSSTYGEHCAITTSQAGAEAQALSCNITYLGARTNGTGAERQSTTFLETASHSYDADDRSWAPVPITITDGPELPATPTAPPGGEEGAVASGGGAAQGSGGAENGAGGALAWSSSALVAAVGALVLWL